MAAKLDPLFLERTRQEYNRLYALRPREASAFLRYTCKQNDLNYKTLHKHLKLGKRKSPEQPIAVQVKRAEIDSYTRMIWEFAQSNTFDLNVVTVALAFEHLQSEKRLPETLTIRQVYDSMERQHLRNDSTVTWKQTREVKEPMDRWQMDFSKSRYAKHRVSSAGEIQIVKPVTTKRQDDGVSLWFGVAIDMHSRVMYAEYFLSRGENAESVIEFTLHAFEEKRGSFLLQGVPKSIYVDNGPGWIDGRTEKGLKRLHVKEILGGHQKDFKGRPLPKRNKQARGLVERAVQTLKNQMEAALYLKLGDGRKLSLEELNGACRAWIEEWNQGAHPKLRDDSKMNLFLAHSGKQFERLHFPPDDARAFFSRSIMKKVIRRKILVAKNTYAFAPSFANDGEDVEIVRDQTGWYLFNGEMHKLTLESDQVREDAKAVSFVEPVERKDAKLSDLKLRQRFNDELSAVLGLRLDRISDDEWNDIAPFFDAPRSVAEIEEQVQWMKIKREAIVAKPMNVIQLPPDNFVR